MWFMLIITRKDSPPQAPKADPYVKLPDSKSSEEETAGQCNGTDKPSQSDVGKNSESNDLPKQSVVLELSGECTINKTITPIRLHTSLRYFKRTDSNEPVRWTSVKCSMEKH